MEVIKHILEDRYYKNKSFIEVTKKEYNQYKEFLKSYTNNDKFHEQLTYDGKTLIIK